MDLQALLEQIDGSLGDLKARAEAGEDVSAELAKLEGKDTRELSRFVGADADPATVRKMLDAGFVAPGAPGGATPTTGRGWKSGHWSAAFADQKSLTPSGGVTVPSLSSGLVQIGDRPTRLLDVIPTESLSGTDQFGYLKETVRDHKAAEVAAGALKPTSVYSVKKIEDRVRVIATLSEPLPRQLLDDVPLLRQYVDGAMRQSVQLRLDQQVLLGDGTGENLTGVGEDAGRTKVAFDTDLFTTARKAVTALEDQEVFTGVFVLDTSVWEDLELTATSVGDFYLSGPVNRGEKKFWGAPVITTTALADSPERGFFIDFEGSTKLYEREGVRLDWSENVYRPDALGPDEGASDFEVNQITFRAEGRYGLATLRPSAVIEFETVDS